MTSPSDPTPTTEAEVWTTRHLHATFGDAVYCVPCFEHGGAQARAEGLDVEVLSAAMSEAYEYVDDNGTPALPFYDDFQAFWDPFAAKVRAILAGETE